MGLLGLALGIAVGKRFLVLPAFVSTMLVLHGTHGWYPLLPLFRRVGVRTQDEIDRYAPRVAERVREMVRREQQCSPS